MILGDQHVNGRHDEQREQRADVMPLTRMMPMLLRAAAPAPVTSVSGKLPATVATGGHQHWAQPRHGGFADGLRFRPAPALKLVGKLAR